jgi:hypothetical protein
MEMDNGSLVISPLTEADIKTEESQKGIVFDQARNQAAVGDFIYEDPSEPCDTSSIAYPPCPSPLSKVVIKEVFSTGQPAHLTSFTLPEGLVFDHKTRFLPPSAEQVTAWEEKIRQLLDDLLFPRELTRIIARLML